MLTEHQAYPHYETCACPEIVVNIVSILDIDVQLRCSAQACGRGSPLQAAGEDVVASLLRQHRDGLLQAHVEAQALAHVVAHLLVARHVPAHLAARRLQHKECLSPLK